MDDFEDCESLEELNEYNLQQEGNEDIEEPLDSEYDELEDTEKPKKPRKIVIPPHAHPLEAFMLTYGFDWSELVTITNLSKEVLLGIIRGDSPTDEEWQRIRLTTGVRV